MPGGLGSLIRAMREERGLSTRELGKLTGLSYSYIAQLERGQDPRTGKPVVPTIDTLAKLAGGFGLTLEDLLAKAGYFGRGMDVMSTMPVVYAVTTGSHLKPQTTLGDNIRFLRTKNALTQEQLARMIHVDRSTLASWESNRRTPEAPMLRKLALALRCSVDFLLDLASDMVPGVASGQQTSAGLDDERAAKLAELDDEDRREILQAIDTKWAEKRDPVFDKYPWLRRVPPDLLPDTVAAVKEGFVDGMFMRRESGVTLDNMTDDGLRLFVEALVDYKRKNDEEKRRRGLMPKDENSQ